MTGEADTDNSKVEPINHTIQEGEEEKKKSGKYGVISNAVNFIGGVSFLGLPFAIKESGLIGGLCFLGLVAILTEWSHRLIVESSKFHHKLQYASIESYEALVGTPFGRVGERVLLFSVFVVAFGACVEFTVMIKDLLFTLMNGGTMHLIVVWSIFIAPLTWIKDLSSLTFVSILSLGLSAFLVAVIMIEAPWYENVVSHGGLAQVMQDYAFRSHVFTTISIFTEVFAWQHGIFQFFNSLRRPTIHRWRFVTTKVNSIISIIYIMVSVPAYLGYLDDTTGDIFLSLPSQGTGSTLTNIARLCFLFICIFTLPLEMMVAKDVIKAAFNRLSSIDDDAYVHGASTNIVQSSTFCSIFISGRELLIVILLDLLALGLGILFKDLGDACALVGAIGGSLASFIIPGLVYLGVNGDDFIAWTNHLLLGPDHSTNITTTVIDGYNTNPDVRVYLTDRPKPWWYYLLGFPIWCFVADWGAAGVTDKIKGTVIIANYTKDSSIVSPQYTEHRPSSSDYFIYNDLDSNSNNTIVLSGKRGTRGKFIIAICLILAGLTTLVVGIIERF